MEQLWDDLGRHSDQVMTPAWHYEVLSEREQNIYAGGAVFEDWGAAKKRIRDSKVLKSVF